MNQDPKLLDSLAKAGLALSGARTVLAAAHRNAQSWAVAAKLAGMSEREIADALGRVVSHVRVHQWTRSLTDN